jgi:hypothetical protein
MSQQLLAAWAIAMILGVNLNAKPNKGAFAYATVFTFGLQPSVYSSIKITA